MAVAANDRMARPARPARPARLLAVALLAVGCVLAGAAPARVLEAADDAPPAGRTPDEIRALAERVVADEAFQRELPGDEPDRPRRPFALPPLVAQVLRWLLYAVLAAALVAAVVALGSTLFGRVRDRRGGAAVGGARRPVPEAGPAPGHRGGPPRRRSLEEVEALAAAGEYGEAVHGLLLLALERLSERTGRRFRPSRTSREILRTGGLDDASRRPLTVLVAAVEQALFATLPLAAADYERCREAYRALAGEA